ncbi:hypothetical protein [Paracoccus sp. R86501]|uniref:hypothetical protein n=1 Tax=Paracoccus sp. R86501 TaxID=3101711 RepID=UPI00366F9353
MRRSTYFHATPKDMHALLQQVEAQACFVYAEHPDVSARHVTLYDTARQIPDLMRMFPGHFTHPLYLMAPDARPEPEPYGHIAGTRYRLTPRQVSSAVVVQLTGEHPDGPLLRSQFWLCGTAPEIIRLENILFRTMRRTFTNIKGTKIGPQALEQLRAGRRLTYDIRAPDGADVQLP